MTREEVNEVFEKYGRGTYIIKMKGGRKMVRRLGISEYGEVLLMCKRSKRYGTYCGYKCDNWESITFVSQRCSLALFKKHIKDAIKILEVSGLWGDIKENLEKFLGYGDDFVERYYNLIQKDSYEAWGSVNNENSEFYGKFRGISEILGSLCEKNCWKSVPYCGSDRWCGYIKGDISDAIKNKRNYDSGKWRNWYDNSVEVKFDCEDNINRGWYSAEYKNCGNGHYYLLFDATHAIFYEDD